MTDKTHKNDFNYSSKYKRKDKEKNKIDYYKNEKDNLAADGDD